MNFLCFDISSGGVSAALFNSQLESVRAAENSWHFETDDRGAATLPLETVVACCKGAIRTMRLDGDRIDAICIGTFMHSFLLMDDAGSALTPVFTWLDSRGDAGLQYVRSRVGERFHQLTGCRYHPMFPVFKLAAMRLDHPALLERTRHVVSIKALLIHRLTGNWIEDHGMASASGLLNIKEGNWDSELLNLLGLDSAQLPALGGWTEIAGRVESGAASEFGVTAGVPVIAGSGDGFLANVGSDCGSPERLAVTLGTSAVVRQTVSRAVLDSDAGTFCYKANRNDYLLGCAGSNGGNVLDWGRRIFGMENVEASTDPPILIPLLHGERSPDWDPRLTGSWHGLTALHGVVDLSRSVLEGVIFNLAHFAEIVQQASGESATDLVLSGNGFLHPLAAPLLAAATSINTWMPGTPGLASLRGAGICALRALGLPFPEFEIQPVPPLNDPKIVKRYREYRRLRGRAQTQPVQADTRAGN